MSPAPVSAVGCAAGAGVRAPLPPSRAACAAQPGLLPLSPERLLGPGTSRLSGRVVSVHRLKELEEHSWERLQ